MIRWWRWIVVCGVVLMFARPAAGAPARQFVIRGTATAAAAVGQDTSDNDLAETISWLMKNKLGLPVPATTVFVYPDQSSFVDAIVEIGKETRENAVARAQHSKGVETAAGILVRGDLLARLPLIERAELFAHELTHRSQRKLRDQGQHRAVQWICEGHAEWVRFKVLDLLQLRPIAESRAQSVQSIKAAGVSAMPSLETIAKHQAWLDARNRLGKPATYGQAFLAVDWLIERFGHAKLIDLFGQYATATESGQAWSTAYPMIHHRQFIDEFRVRLNAM
jgi:hypothetical protein